MSGSGERKLQRWLCHCVLRHVLHRPTRWDPLALFGAGENVGPQAKNSTEWLGCPLPLPLCCSRISTGGNGLASLSLGHSPSQLSLSTISDSERRGIERPPPSRATTIRRARAQEPVLVKWSTALYPPTPVSS